MVGNMKECLEFINNFEMEINILKDLIEKQDSEKLKKLLSENVDSKNDSLMKHKSILESISSDPICCRLYAKLLNGKTPTRAVEEVANENYFNNIKPSSVSSIWRYYLKLKDIIK